MRFELRNGLWTLGEPVVGPPPMTLAVEAVGAVLEWPLGAAPGAAPTITLLDVGEADWLWRLVGEDTHARLLGAVAAATPIDLETTFDDDLRLALHRLGHALWARAWWPASRVDGLPDLPDSLLLDDIVALCEVLVPILGDVLPDDQPAAPTLPRHTEFALAASGDTAEAHAEPLASGTAPLSWQGVPAGVFDATEYPVRWSVEAHSDVELAVRVTLADPARRSAQGIAVAAEVPGLPPATGHLDERGQKVLTLPMAPRDAWTQDWDALDVRVGVGTPEPRSMRDAIRAHARSRLATQDALSLAAEEFLRQLDY